MSANNFPTKLNIILFKYWLCNMTGIGNGYFDFVRPGERVMYSTAHEAITQLELWTFMKREDGIIFPGCPEFYRISDKIKQLGFLDHSGASFAHTIRVMQYIATKGYDNFKHDYLDNIY